VRESVHDGWVTREEALERYGVVLTNEARPSVDASATREAREGKNRKGDSRPSRRNL